MDSGRGHGHWWAWTLVGVDTGGCRCGHWWAWVWTLVGVGVDSGVWHVTFVHLGYL